MQLDMLEPIDYRGFSKPNGFSEEAIKKLPTSKLAPRVVHKRVSLCRDMDNNQHWAIKVGWIDDHGFRIAEFDAFTGEYLGESF